MTTACHATAFNAAAHLEQHVTKDDNDSSSSSSYCCCLLIQDSEVSQPMKADQGMDEDENRHRRIHFNSTVSTVSIPSRENFTSEMKRDLWFQPDEIALVYAPCTHQKPPEPPCFIIDYFFPQRKDEHHDDACISVGNGRAVNNGRVAMPTAPYHPHPNNSRRRARRVDSLLIRLKI